MVIVETDFGVTRIAEETLKKYEEISRSPHYPRENNASKRRAHKRIELLALELALYKFMMRGEMLESL